jgi:hypothetical protein
VPVWSILFDNPSSTPGVHTQCFWLERASNQERIALLDPTAQTPPLRQRLIDGLNSLLRPESASAPMYYAVFAALGYVGFCAMYIHLICYTDYRWLFWRPSEIILYLWSLLYIVEIINKASPSTFDQFMQNSLFIDISPKALLFASYKALV